ncbi:MAG: recombination mediator RecR [Puniceicoccales bacterium]|jgi:recombination protein RecR|nr:recombination mediator RecR [Puniceicoccales bacterium]
MTGLHAFENARQLLKQLPGLGYRSAERIALHLLVENPERLQPLLEALRDAAEQLHRCERCGNLAESTLCKLCTDPHRNGHRLCIIEQIPDLLALERANAHDGCYHVLHGKLSPIRGIGPEQLNLASLEKRLSPNSSENIEEIILALSNDIEGEATCHYIQGTLLAAHPAIHITRIGFGIPSGTGPTYVDPTTLKNAIAARRQYQ